MRNFSLFFTTFLFFAMSAALVQGQKDHFQTSEQCVASSHTQYHPDLKHPKPLAKGETIQKIQTDGCYEMVLPDRFGGRGWVWLGSGTEFVIGSDKQVLRLAECGNTIFNWVPITSQPAPATVETPTPVVEQPTELAEKIVSELQTKVGCPDITPRSMTTPVKGILRRVTTHVEQPCGGTLTVVDDEQMTVENRKMQMHRDDLAAKVEIAKAKAEAKAKQPSCGFWCSMLTTPAYPVAYGYGYGYGGGGYNTGYNTGGGYGGGGHHGGGGGGNNSTYGPPLNTGGAH